MNKVKVLGILNMTAALVNKYNNDGYSFSNLPDTNIKHIHIDCIKDDNILSMKASFIDNGDSFRISDTQFILHGAWIIDIYHPSGLIIITDNITHERYKSDFWDDIDDEIIHVGEKHELVVLYNSLKEILESNKWIISPVWVGEYFTS